LLREAGSLGNAQALFELGKAYEKGIGVGQNVDKALDYYKMAGALGYGRADYNRAYLYEKGALVEQDIALAIDLYDSAAKKGYVKAAARSALLRDQQLRENGEREASNTAVSAESNKMTN
jgi:TPR repeat protein